MKRWKKEKKKERKKKRKKKRKKEKLVSDKEKELEVMNVFVQ